MGILNIKDGNQWQSILAIKGEKGDTGERGLQGEQGIPGQGIASGGAAGQILVKTSSTDYATGWSDVPNELLLITITGTSTLSSDKTQSEISTAYNAGKVLVVKNNNDLYLFTKYENSKFYFGMHDDISGNDVIQLTVIEIASNGINKTSSYVESSSMHMASMAYDSNSGKKYINEYASSLYQLFDTDPIRSICVSDDLDGSDIKHKYIVRAIEETDNGVSTYKFYLLCEDSLEIYEGNSDGYAQLKEDTSIDYAKNVKKSFAKTSLFSYENDDSNAEFEVKAYIEPIQDLHGYDNPWPAGGGINMIPSTLSLLKTRNTGGTWNGNAYTISDVTFTVNDDGTITVNGTSTAAVYFNYIQSAAGSRLPITAGTYILHKTGSSDINISVGKDGGYWGAATTSDSTLTIESDVGLSAYSYIASGKTFSNFILKPMFEKASTASPWSPYSNICPITGWSEVTVTRTGKNLWDEQYTDISSTIRYKPVYVGDGQATLSTTNPQASAAVYNLFLLAGNVSSGASSIENGVWEDHPRTVTAVDGYVTVAYRIYEGSTSPALSQTQLELGSTATSYEPYVGTTYTIQLGQTVYGGTLDVTSGKLVIDRYMWVLTNPLASVNSTSGDNVIYDIGLDTNSKPNGVNYSYISNRFSDSIPAGTPGRGVLVANHLYLVIAKSELSSYDRTGLVSWLSTNTTQVCYELATPTEVTLTPAQIQTLIGVNNIWSDSGNVEVTVKQGIEAYVDNRSLPLGGSSGQVLKKASSSDYDVEWDDAGSSLPSGGTAGQILTKASGTDYDVSWGNAPSTLPSGGSTGQVLKKASATDNDVEWANETQPLPSGGATGQVLKKASATDNDVEWGNETQPLPSGGSAGQVLKKASATDYDVEWGSAGSAVPSGGSTGQVLMKSSATDGDVSWGSESFIIPITKSGSNYTTSMSITQIMDAYNAGKKLYISVPSASSYSGRTSTDYYKLSRVQAYSNGYQYNFYFSGAPYVTGNSAEFRCIYININTNSNTKQVYQSGNLTQITPTPESAINVYYYNEQGQDPYYELEQYFVNINAGDFVNLEVFNPAPNTTDYDSYRDWYGDYFPLEGIVISMEEAKEAQYDEYDEQWEYYTTYIVRVLATTSSGQLLYTFESDDAQEYMTLTSTTPIGGNSGGGTMYVHITYANNAYSADKTFAEITQAVSDGSSVCAILGNDYYPLNSINSSSALFKNNGENVSNHFPSVKTVTISSSNTVSATNIQLTGKNVVDTILIRFDVLLDSNNNKLYIEGSPDGINDLGNDYLYSICEWQGSECSLPVRITKEDVTVSGSTETKITISVDRWENGSLIVHNFTGTTDGSYLNTGFYEESTIDVAQSIISQIPSASGVSF